MTRRTPASSLLHRLAVSFTSALLLGLASTIAVAQGRLDVPAQGKIDEAINVHYLATDFVKAEQLLAGTINACGNQCSAPIIAKAWMYIGLIRGVGGQNMAGAKEAFRSAVAAFPGVALDTDLSTPEVQAAFNEISGQSSSAATSAPANVVLTPPASAPEPEPEPAAPPAPPPPIQCEPKVQEVQTRRSVPVSCVSKAPGVARGTLFYKEFGAQTYNRVPMKLVNGAWQAEVPCTATGMGGSLSWYMEASDRKGSRVDGYGDAEGPVDIMLSDATTEAPPHYPGKPAPPRCADLSDCPPEMIGTPACPGTEGQVVAAAAEGKGWGEACEAHSECQEGMGCLNGTCETGPSCSSDADCDDGRCDMTSGTCTYSGESSESSESSSGAKGPTNMISLSLARDFTIVSGTALCDRSLNPNSSCYFDDKPYVIANPTSYTRTDAATGAMVEQKTYWNGGDTNTLGQGLIRILLAYDRMLTENISAGVNAGIAISPIPDAPVALHLDAHGRYWLSGNGEGIKVFIGAGFGLGQVDSIASTTVDETQYQDSAYRRTLDGADPNGPAGQGSSGVVAGGTGFTPKDPADPTTAPCQPAESFPDRTFRREFCKFSVDAGSQHGSLFVGVGAGAWLNLGGHGPQLELMAKILFPETGISLQPALSYVYGF